MTGAGSLTWLGHSCAVIQIDGHVFVTDPVLRRRIFHLRRQEPVDPAALDGIDAILLSHSHHDHLDLRSLDRLDRARRCWCRRAQAVSCDDAAFASCGR